eukprot:TCONS_00048541-protein
MSIRWHWLLPIIFIYNSFAAIDFCHRLARSDANSRNANWFPETCTTQDSERGGRCYMKCLPGFSIKPNALASLDCLKINSTTWSRFESEICVRDQFCPPLGSSIYQNNCRFPNIKPGVSCHMNYSTCSYERMVGPSILKCQSNLTWSEGGTYCKDEFSVTLTCPTVQSLVEVDPQSNTKDARKIIPLPTVTGLSPSQVISPDLNVGVGYQNLKFSINESIGVEKSCFVRFTVTDKEPPVPISCTEEQEQVIQAGKRGKMVIGKCVFHDNVNGDINGTFNNRVSADGSIAPGVYEHSFFMAEDSERNNARVYQKYIVHEKKCEHDGPLSDTIELEKMQHLFRVKCKNATFQSYIYNMYQFRSQIPVEALTLFVYCSNANFTKFSPILECFPTVKPDNDTKKCEDGSVLNEGPNLICIPCPRGFEFISNSTGTFCQKCPTNMSTDGLGSLNGCKQCPSSQMTVGGLPVCKYICKGGESYEGGKCNLCQTGFYADQGATSCIKCPSGKTTLSERSTSVDHCLPGLTVTSNNGTIDNLNVLKNTSTYVRFDITGIAENQLHQNIVVRFEGDFSFLCTEGYVQIIGYFEEFKTNVIDRLCGDKAKGNILFKLRPWRQTSLQIFSNNNMNEIKLNHAYSVCKAGQYHNLTTHQCTDCQQGTYQNKQNQYSCQPCAAGKTNYGPGMTACIKPCPSGFEGEGLQCKPCPIGTFEENRQCKQCPNGQSTRFERSTSCEKACSKGEYLNADNTCSKCAYGRYQPLERHSQRECFYCPKDKTTIKMGSDTIDDCFLGKDQCKYEGQYYNTTLNSCQDCPIASYKEASGFTPTQCTRCADGETTKQEASIRPSDCIPILTPCQQHNPCQFPGQCVDKNGNATCVCPRYYTGQFCEKLDGPCKDVDCNNGSCVPFPNSKYVDHVCICKPGFTGKKCESAHDPCEPNPCYNSNCTNTKPGDYNCSCPLYWGGKRCEKRLYSPCMNASNCNIRHARCTEDPNVHGKFECKCYRGYEGPNCDEEIDWCEKFPCQLNNTARCRPLGDGTRECHCKTGFAGETCQNVKDCGIGQFYHDERCCDCLQGKFHDDNNTVAQCTKCPDGLTTFLRGSRTAQDCKDVSKEEYLVASFRLPQHTYQGPYDPNDDSCGYLGDTFEQTLFELLKKGTANSTKGVHLINFRKPPDNKEGLLMVFKVYGNIETNEKELTKIERTASVGQYWVDAASLDIIETKKGSTTTPPTDEKDKDGLTTGTIIGIVIGILVLVALIVLLAVWLRGGLASKLQAKRKSFRSVSPNGSNGSNEHSQLSMKEKTTYNGAS